MNVKRILAIIIFVAGVVMLFVAYDIKKQIAEGTLKVTKAEKSVGQANSLFSLNPTVKQLTQGSMQGAEKKIAAGKQDIAHYTKLANELQIGGFVLVGAGILLFILGGGHHGHQEKNKKR